MAATPQQKSNFITAARRYGEALARLMSDGMQLRDMWNDLGLQGTIQDADFTGDNAGITAADFSAAITAIGADLTEWTAARRTAINKIGHGTP
jgi:hypothetical protein